MKKRIFSVIVALSFALALVVPTQAKTFSFKIKADIPFDFQVGNKKLPKGEYTVESLNDSVTLTIRQVKKGKAISFIAIRGKMIDKPKAKLIFHRYGEEYFLARIWDGTSDTILKLDKSKAEKRAEKQAKKAEEVSVGDK